MLSARALARQGRAPVAGDLGCELAIDFMAEWARRKFGAKDEHLRTLHPVGRSVETSAARQHVTSSFGREKIGLGLSRKVQPGSHDVGRRGYFMRDDTFITKLI
jgi:hypothetical protein